ncbi:hypothetical protein M9H77_22389 [Catharanthus roseus]|uniref:Uncharacterized protein n=1 Tax=Catharanthus roseus TaxID=4058 RepID=A0ACC0AR19_CATRO|nr:hypothetical protein M9H77_22389 [Catharanthus roseus]
MVKVKNANVGMGENYKLGEISIGGRKGKGKKVASNVRLPERFISVKAAANFEEWTRKTRKIAPRHRVDLTDMGIGDHIGIRKICNKYTFKRMGCSRNEEGILVRGGQEDDDESDEEEEGEDKEQDAMDVDEEVREEKHKMQYVVDGIMYFVNGIMLMRYDLDSLRRTKDA